MKVIVLTRGDLITTLRKFIRTNNPNSDVWLNGQESADAIVRRFKCTEGRAEHRAVLNFVILMGKTQKAANHATGRDYQKEVGMESRGKAGEQSYAKAEIEGEDKSSLNTQDLLEKIIEKGNLNEAYKRVKKNDGSPGIDKMKVTSLLSYLQEQGGTLRQSILGRYVQTPTGTQGRNSQTGRRSKVVGNPNSTRPDDTTGESPSINTDIRAGVFRTQL